MRLKNKADETRALAATSIDDIWGIGRRTVPRLRTLGLETALDLVNYPHKKIEKDFSAPLAVLQRELAGEPVLALECNTDPRSQKSIQATATFRPASTSPKTIWRELAENAERACENARALKLVTNKISFFVKSSEFKYYFGETKLALFTADPGAVLNAIEPLFPRTLPKNTRIRSTGVILHDLRRQERIPLDLFGQQANTLGRLAVENAADKIRQKYGPSALTRLASLGKTRDLEN